MLNSKTKAENRFEGVRVVTRFGNPFTMRQENIERAAKDLADYLTDCAAGKQEYSADVEKRLRYVLHGFKTGQWVVTC